MTIPLRSTARWICTITLSVTVLIVSLFVGDVTDSHVNAQTAPAPAAPCFSIFENGSDDYLLNQCTGDSWRYDDGYNWSTSTQESPPAWVAIPTR